MKNLKTQLKATEDDLLNAGEVPAKLIELEDRSRRNNLITRSNRWYKGRT